MAEEPDYILDIGGLGGGSTPEQANPPTSSDQANGEKTGSNWIGIRFECCGAYVRIYRNREGTAYEGACPRCARPVRIRVGPGGTSNRLFRAS